MTAASVVMTAWCMADGSGTGRTATGVVPLVGYTVAADWRVYAPGTVLLVLGLGVRVVEDRGSKVRGAQLDDYHGADAAACASAKAWGRQAREVLVLHRPTGRSTDAVKNVSAQAKVRAGERGNSPAHLPSVEASPSGATAGLENPASRSSMELRGRLTETPTENGRPGGRCPHASTEGSDEIREDGRLSFSERVAAGGHGETRDQAISHAGEATTVAVAIAGGAAHPLLRGASEEEKPRLARSHPGAGAPAPGLYEPLEARR